MSDISQNSTHNIDMMTLAFLTNPFSKAKLDSLNLHHKEDSTRRKELRSDIRFYRRRLFNVVKCLINNKDIPSEVSTASLQAWNILARHLIDDFRVLDTHDTIQQELKDVSLNDLSNISSCSARDSQLVLDRANKEIMATKTIPVTLDKFVIKKPMKQPYPWCSNRENIKIPETIVNLSKEELRTKGVKRKEKRKENVTSEYEKKNEEHDKKQTAEQAKRGQTKSKSSEKD